MLKAEIAHPWFSVIHPFDDGNGRISRAVTDYLLARSYPSLMVLVSFSKYISVDIPPLLKWFLQTFETTLQESQWIVEQIA